ncbi:transmembrane protein, putative (macronuclear) [Tetrahymena thermophila SB210]|uniref:Transmembrane protein, putative n=1 Tax=Tetrahymena thermophila (strain SB210) TaxID=312017 RepID=W7X4M0_TETTS|nr:transmembrane protein, putative [Tetrahymena thermophila SB210]EWS72347.1 transmembrane protein, putative [Tetrahymena thermophila SB210]|eukprot:XP_012655124.1 transmembrane protein, putative [Tetrahymena thermophila SB210]
MQQLLLFVYLLFIFLLHHTFSIQFYYIQFQQQKFVAVEKVTKKMIFIVYCGNFLDFPTTQAAKIKGLNVTQLISVCKIIKRIASRFLKKYIRIIKILLKNFLNFRIFSLHIKQFLNSFLCSFCIKFSVKCEREGRKKEQTKIECANSSEFKLCEFVKILWILNYLKFNHAKYKIFQFRQHHKFFLFQAIVIFQKILKYQSICMYEQKKEQILKYQNYCGFSEKYLKSKLNNLIIRFDGWID